jgi:hypothetical protein
MGVRRRGFRRWADYRAVGGRCLSVGLLLLAAYIIVGPARSTAAQSALPPIVVPTPKSQLECEQTWGLGTGWHRCFSQRPGSNCTHPLEVQKTYPNFRGDTKDFTVTLEDEHDGEGALLSYSYAPKKGIAICPHGAVFKVSLLAEEGRCERIRGHKFCSNEYDTKNIFEPTRRDGGQFMYVMPTQPVRSWYLAVRGYYIHPPRIGGG